VRLCDGANVPSTGSGWCIFGVHVFGAAFAVEEDEAAHPVQIGRLGAVGVVLDAQGIADLIEGLPRCARSKFFATVMNRFYELGYNLCTMIIHPVPAGCRDFNV